MRHIQITTKTYRDNSARSIDLPTILIEHDNVYFIDLSFEKYNKSIL